MKNINFLKILFFIIVLNSFGTYSQETEFTFTPEKGMTDYIVTKLENKNSTEIYNKIIEWIKVTYKNPDKVILSTIENEYIRFEGSSSKCYAINMLGKSYQETKYQIEISIKDGRYKFDLIGMENYSTASDYSAGGWTKNIFFDGALDKETLNAIFKKDGSFKNVWKYIPDVPIYFNNLNISIKEYVISNIKKTDEGW